MDVYSSVLNKFNRDLKKKMTNRLRMWIYICWIILIQTSIHLTYLEYSGDTFLYMHDLKMEMLKKKYIIKLATTIFVKDRYWINSSFFFKATAVL